MKKPKTKKLCKAKTVEVPDWMTCQLGRNHHGPFHIYADENCTLQWAAGEDGYVPEECPDPSAHEDIYE